MNKNAFMSKITRGYNKTMFQLKKHSPEILIVAGVAGTVVSAVMACKATTKIGEILEESKETIDTIHDAQKNEALAEKYPENVAQRDLAIIYIQTGVKLAKLYAPSVILGTLSITSILASNNILRKRNVALAAAYATVDKGFKEYRSRVIEKFGEEVDQQLRFGTVAEKIEETVTDEDGKTKKVKKTVGVSEISDYGDYAVYFDKSSPYFEGNDDYDMMFLRAQQNYANDLLRARGYLTLNEVLDGLGIQGTKMLRKAGMVVGWKYEKDNQYGDNDVCFDIYSTYRKREDGNVEPCIILDFNVEGSIYDRM